MVTQGEIIISQIMVGWTCFCAGMLLEHYINERWKRKEKLKQKLLENLPPGDIVTVEADVDAWSE